MTAALGVALAALALAACGSAGDGSGRGTTSAAADTPEKPRYLSKAQFIARADPICRSTYRQLDALDKRLKEQGLELGGQVTPEAETAYVVARNKIERRQVRRLRALRRPRDSRPVERYAEALERIIAISDSQIEVLSRADFDSYQTLRDVAHRAGARAKGIAEGYGFEICGTTDQPTAG